MTVSLKLIDIHSLDRFQNDLLKAKLPEEIQSLLIWYVKSFDGINFEFGYDRPIIRARLCHDADGFGHVNDLHSPPPIITKIGRMNEKNQPMFYASYHIGTALAEINAKEGDIVQIAQFKLTDNLSSLVRCLVVGEFYNAYHGTSTISQGMFSQLRELIDKLGKNGITHLLSYLYMDALSADLLNDTSSSKNSYIYSRTLSRLLLEKSPGIDGLIFPSSKIKGTANITLRPESILTKANIASTQVIKITSLYPYGLFDYEVLKQSEFVDSSGCFIWSNA